MKKKFNCKHCGKLKDVSHRNTNQYCSVQCQMDAKFLKRFIEWKNGAVETSNKWFRRALTYMYGHKCSVCSISEWKSKPIVLEVEHKDGNSDNNNIENLCLICPNCHSQTPTYKGANRGNGRHTRRIRYHEGKSY